jgi:hypothetical protein
VKPLELKRKIIAHRRCAKNLSFRAFSAETFVLTKPDVARLATFFSPLARLKTEFSNSFLARLYPILIFEKKTQGL